MAEDIAQLCFNQWSRSTGECVSSYPPAGGLSYYGIKTQILIKKSSHCGHIKLIALICPPNPDRLDPGLVFCISSSGARQGRSGDSFPQLTSLEYDYHNEAGAPLHVLSPTFVMRVFCSPSVKIKIPEINTCSCSLPIFASCFPRSPYSLSHFPVFP